jgi:hypothetical protein
MNKFMNYPLFVSLLTFVVLAVGMWIGAELRRRRHAMDQPEREDFGVILAATLTLLGLIIGFSFSMATSRYDQRKNYEEQEANAIGTEYVRADLLPAGDAEKVRGLLRRYLGERVQFYNTRDFEELRQVNAATSETQGELWRAVRGPAVAAQTAVSALAVSGMNDVLNSQGYTQAAWWNRIPVPAWGLMGAIAICCTVMMGYYVRPAKGNAVRLMVLPLIVAISFFLIADIDSPRGGVIRVKPQNLVSLAESLNGH